MPPKKRSGGTKAAGNKKQKTNSGSAKDKQPAITIDEGFDQDGQSALKFRLNYS